MRKNKEIVIYVKRLTEVFVLMLLSINVMAQAPRMAVYPDFVNFGFTSGETPPVIKKVNIFNQGDRSLAITSLKITGSGVFGNQDLDWKSFSYINGCSIILPGESCVIDVIFDASSPGNKSAKLIIGSNDPAMPTVAVALFGGCHGRCSSLHVGKQQASNVIVPSTTKVLDDSSLAKLIIVQDYPAGPVFYLIFDIFNGSTPVLDSIAVNDVVVSDTTIGRMNNFLPDGFLGKVISVNRVQSNLIISAQFASLEEAIQEADFANGVMLDETAIESIKVLQPEFENSVVMMTSSVGRSFNEDLLSGKVNVNGSIDFSADFNFGLKISWFKVKQFKAATTFGTTTQFNIVVRDVDSNTHRKQLPIAIQFSRITIWAGPIPLVFTPKLVFVGEVKGSNDSSTELIVNGRTVCNFTFGVEYTSYGGWKSLNKGPNPILTYSASVTNVISMTYKASLEASFEFLLYGFVGPYGGISGYEKFVINSSANPQWKLYAGADVFAGVKIEIIGKRLTYQTSVNVWEYQVAQGGSPPPAFSMNIPRSY